ncbi:MAG: hypothetical protein Q7U68_02255 [Candidatus Roizmanbacteria bacterium]|nr:hypothetical protein [Candidatus Roizmanbacteria bacterium]
MGIKKSNESAGSLKQTIENTKNTCLSVCAIENVLASFSYNECKYKCKDQYNQSIKDSGVKGWEYDYLNKLMNIGCK